MQLYLQPPDINRAFLFVSEVHLQPPQLLCRKTLLCHEGNHSCLLPPLQPALHSTNCTAKELRATAAFNNGVPLVLTSSVSEQF
jgi:hypothetical protein